MKKKNILITGASVGIGAAIARRFVQANDHVILVARRKNHLEALQKELGKENASTFPLDVTSRSNVHETIELIEHTIGPIDILINNAGGAYGLDKAQEANIDDWETCVDLNIKGVLYCTHSILPKMVKRNRGHIINLGSTAGHYPYPGGNAYGASKAFVHHFSLNLRADLLGTSIRVTCVEPGMVEGTEFSKVRFHGDNEKAKNVYANTEPLRPEDVAEVIYQCTALPAHVNINTIEMTPVCQAPGPLAIHRN